MTDCVKKTLRLTIEQDKRLKERSKFWGFKTESAYLIHLLGEDNGPGSFVEMKNKLDELSMHLEQIVLDIISARKYAATAYLYALQTAGKSVEMMQKEIDRLKAEAELEIKERKL